MSTVIGEISSLEGMVRAIESTTQTVRILEVGDPVFKNELIVTSSPANVMLVLNNGEVLILGRNSELFLDGDVFEEVVSNSEAVADVATLQQFVLEGEFDALEDPAAGVTGSPESAIEEGVEIERTAAEGEVTAGFSTDYIPSNTAVFGGALTNDDPFADESDRGDEELKANPDVNEIFEDENSIDGNVVLGTGANLHGADQLINDVNLVIDVNGVAISALSDNPTVIPGLYGSLEIKSNGSYVYYLDNTHNVVQGLNDGQSIEDVFVYIIRDGDNDTSSTTLTITINGQTDGPPVLEIEDVDGALTVADHSVVEATGQIITGTMTVSADAGVASVTINGTEVTAASATNPILIPGGTQGLLTVTSYDEITGVITYEFKEDGLANDHSAGDDQVEAVYNVVVTDFAGVPVEDDLNIQILDTAPEARPDHNSVVEDDVSSSVSGNVITGSNGQGIDAASTDIEAADRVIISSVDGVAVAPGAPATVIGQYGTLVLRSDGSYDYMLDNSNPDVQALTSASMPISESFTYTLSDSDGDSDAAELTISIHGQDDAPPVIVDCDDSVVEGTGDAVTGVFGVSAEAGVASIVIAGVEVIDATVSNPKVIQGTDGVLTITGYDPVIGAVSYSYTENGTPNDHSAGDDSVKDTFEVVVTDFAGQTTVDYHDIQILDTAPVAVNDENNIVEDSVSVNGNLILENDVKGADSVTVTDANGLSVTPLNSAVVTGAYGTFTISSDGSYVYFLDNTHPDVQVLTAASQPLMDTISYTITDSDGDESSAILKITINGQDDAPPVINVVDEDLGVSVLDNSVEEGSANTIAGAIFVSSEVGVASIQIEGIEVTGATPTTPIIIAGAEGTLTITNYNAVTGELSYEYQEDGVANTHNLADDNVSDHFFIEVMDASGERTTDSLDIQILDTAPIAQADNNEIVEDSPIVEGNVIFNAHNDATQSDILGADNTVVTSIEGVSVSSGTATVSGVYGTLTINADGSYSYELNNAHPDIQSLNDGEFKKDTFEYVITDADGDASTTTLTITIHGVTDGAPVITVEDTDGNVSAADNSVEEGSTTPITGTITISAEAGIDTVEIGGSPLNLNDLANGIPSSPIDTGEGTLTITGYDPVTGELSYSYLVDPVALDHTNGDPVIDSIEITLTDIAGESSQTNLEIAILDSAPQAGNDENSVTEDNVLVATGNVLDTDSAIDTPMSVVTPGTLSGQYGTLVLNTDGSYTYTLDNNHADVQALNASSIPLVDNFSYTMSDSDGSTASANLTINIYGRDDAKPVIFIEDTDGTTSPGHNSVEECSGNSVSGSMTVNAEAGISSVTVAGVNIMGATPAMPVIIQGTQGVLTITSYDSVTGEILYTFTEDDVANDHSAGEFSVLDQFEVMVTDSLGQQNSDNLNIQILDTEPVAVPDVNTLVEPRFEIIPRQIIGFDIPDEYTRESSTDPYHGTLTINTHGVTNYRVVMNGKNIEGASSSNPVEIDMQYATIYITGFDRQTGLVEYTYIGDGRAITSPDDQPDKLETLVSAPVNETLTGNVLMGTGINLDGKDLFCDDSVVTSIAGGVLGQPLQGTYGTVILNSDGSYEYNLDSTHPDVMALDLGEQLIDTFTYTITDADGDSSSTTLTITVDGQTEVPPSVNVVDNDGNITIADHHVTEGTGDVITGSIFFNVTEELSHIRIGGQLVYYNGFRSVEILGYEGKLTITGLDLTTGEITYRYKEDNSAADHRNGDDSIIESFAVIIADKTGATALDSLDIQIMDTAPVAVPDMNTINIDDFDSSYGVDYHGSAYEADRANSHGSQNTSEAHDDAHEQGIPVVLGNVLTGTTLSYGSGPGADIIGADRTLVTEVNGVRLDGAIIDHFVGVEIQGLYGTLTMKSTGQYEYLLDPSNAEVVNLGDNETLTEVFNYTITDKELDGLGWEYGDSSSTTLTITINGSDSAQFGGPLVVEEGSDHCMTLESSALILDENVLYEQHEMDDSDSEMDKLDLSELISDSNVSEESLNDYLNFMDESDDSHYESSEEDHASSSDSDNCQIAQLELESVTMQDHNTLDDQDDYSHP